MTEHHFKSVEFGAAEEKEKVLKAWKQFLAHDFSQKFFTERLYKHLILHCSFIAHYSRDGFYHDYFDDPEETTKLIKQFDENFGYLSTEYGMDCWIKGDFSDLNLAMCEEVSRCKKLLYAKLYTANKKKAAAEIQRLRRKISSLEKTLEE